MNETAATQVAEGFLRGFFDTIDALLATSMRAEPGKPVTLSAADLAGHLARLPAAMHIMIEDGGRVGLLLSARDALSFQAQVLGEDSPDRDRLEDDDVPKLREVFEPCLSGGVSGLRGLLGREPSSSAAAIVNHGGEDAADLLDAFDNTAFAVPFRFEDRDRASGEGILIGSQGVFALFAGSGASGTGGPQLSPEEMNDILSGFDAGVGTAANAVKAAPTMGEIPPNLDMIMDIGLVCTARLGRVEMPIADILSLGPGSILEVGHLVDEPVELLVNDKLIARGDVVVVDEKFGLRITEIVSQADRIKSLL